MESLVENQNAVLLHHRPYTDSKIILELLTERYGRVSGVFRASKKKGRARLPQQFGVINCSWRGRSDLKTFTLLEPSETQFALSSTALFCGLYLNELLVRLLPRDDVHIDVFRQYLRTLATLQSEFSSSQDYGQCLRVFELELLEALGYGIDLRHDIDGAMLEKDADTCYRYDVTQGFIPVNVQVDPLKLLFSGLTLEAISRKDFSCSDVKKAAKILCRKALSVHLGDKPLKSRELFSRT